MDVRGPRNYDTYYNIIYTSNKRVEEPKTEAERARREKKIERKTI